MDETKAAIEKVIDYLTSEFIVEERIDNMVEGCLSCEMIEARSSLRKAIQILDENWTFTPEQLDAHPSPQQQEMK